MKLIFLLGAFLISLHAAWNALAAENQYKVELFGSVGVSGIHDDESYLGSGMNFAGGVDFRLSHRMGLELEVDHARFSRDFASGVRFEGNATVYGGNLQFYFPRSNFEPYLFGGAAVTHFDQTGTFPEGDVFESTQDTFTIQFGGGVRFFIMQRISLRPEFRWSWNEISFVNQLRGSLAIGYSW
jgi:opacity protein-like surface antigen